MDKYQCMACPYIYDPQSEIRSSTRILCHWYKTNETGVVEKAAIVTSAAHNFL